MNQYVNEDSRIFYMFRQHVTIEEIIKIERLAFKRSIRDNHALAAPVYVTDIITSQPVILPLFKN